MNSRVRGKTIVLAAMLCLPLLLAALFADTSAQANEHAEHSTEIPTAVWLQFVNFGLYVALLVYLLRKPVLSYFSSREINYRDALKKADAAKSEAEAKRREIYERLQKLEHTREHAIQEARAEAAALKLQMVEDAKSLAAKLIADAETAALVELERAKIALRRELLDQSVAMAKKLLSDRDRLLDHDQKRLQSEFVEKIQAVSQ